MVRQAGLQTLQPRQIVLSQVRLMISLISALLFFSALLFLSHRVANIKAPRPSISLDLPLHPPHSFIRPSHRPPPTRKVWSIHLISSATLTSSSSFLPSRLFAAVIAPVKRISMAQQRRDPCAEPVIAFIARGDRECEDNDAALIWLRESLTPVVQRYQAEFGPSNRPYRFFTFVLHKSQNPRARHPVISFFRDILDEGSMQNCDIVFVLSGWDALSASQMTVAHMLKECVGLGVNVLLRVFANEVRGFSIPPRFFDVDPINVYGAMTGEYDLEAPDLVLEENTKLFMDELDMWSSFYAWREDPDTMRAWVMSPNFLIVIMSLTCLYCNIDSPA